MACSVGLTVLRLTPLISTTCSLWFAWDQYEFMTLFSKRDLRPLSNQLLPSYFSSFFNRGAPRVIALLVTTIGSTSVILHRAANGSSILHGTGAFSYYAAGKCRQTQAVYATFSNTSLQLSYVPSAIRPGFLSCYLLFRTSKPMPRKRMLQN